MDACPSCGEVDDHKQSCLRVGNCGQIGPPWLDPPWHDDTSYVPEGKTWTSELWREHLREEHVDSGP